MNNIALFFCRDHFYQYGEIRSITLVPRQQCAFIQYTLRAAAESAADRTFNKLILGGRRLSIKWGRSQARQATGARDGLDLMEELEPVPGLPGALPMPPTELQNNFFNLADDTTVPTAATLTPTVMPPPMPPPPIILPPPMPRPPPGIRPPGPPPFFFPPHMRPPIRAPPATIRPPTFTLSQTPLFPPGTAPAIPQLPPNPAPLVPPGTISTSSIKSSVIHYPSQDPSRLGAAQGVSKAKIWPGED